MNLVIPFALLTLALFVVVGLLYYRNTRNKDFVFTYFMIGVVVFFICKVLNSSSPDIGLAIGLFAIFGIIRYRTDAIPIREMTYLFIVIGLSVVNAFWPEERGIGFPQIFANVAIVTAAAIMETFSNRGLGKKKTLIYDKLELLHPDKFALLQEDVQARTGLAITKVNIVRIDLLKEIAEITVYYSKE
ncbi:MAG: DUF4956 domain-containing protein [Bacteroidetes bacterium]|jgi:cell division protein FtsW (lipid II flippase)|nr:DUF4956 domain-containing protein [Bacteroidota bacterium]